MIKSLGLSVMGALLINASACSSPPGMSRQGDRAPVVELGGAGMFLDRTIPTIGEISSERIRVQDNIYQTVILNFQQNSSAEIRGQHVAVAGYRMQYTCNPDRFRIVSNINYGSDGTMLFEMQNGDVAFSNGRMSTAYRLVCDLPDPNGRYDFRSVAEFIELSRAIP